MIFFYSNLTVVFFNYTRVLFYHFIYYLKRSVITIFIIVNIKIYYQKSHRALLVDCRIATECCCGVTSVFYTSTNRCTVLLKVYTCLLLWRIRLGGPLMRARSQNMKLKKKKLKSDVYIFFCHVRILDWREMALND